MAVVREKVASNIYRRRLGNGESVYELSYRDSDGRQRRQAVGPRMAGARSSWPRSRPRWGRVSVWPHSAR